MGRYYNTFRDSNAIWDFRILHLDIIPYEYIKEFAEACKKDISDKYKNDTTAREFLNNIDNAISDISNRVAEIGGIQQRLVTVIDATSAISESVTNAASSIQDVQVPWQKTSASAT